MKSSSLSLLILIVLLLAVPATSQEWVVTAASAGGGTSLATQQVWSGVETADGWFPSGWVDGAYCPLVGDTYKVHFTDQGSTWQFLVECVPGGKLAAAVTGIFVANAPFKGGVMVPSTDFVTYFTTEPGPPPTTVLTVAEPSMTVGMGTTLYVQFWVDDPMGIHGAAATGTLAVVAQ
jgi:hypothetical protein